MSYKNIGAVQLKVLIVQLSTKHNKLINQRFNSRPWTTIDDILISCLI